MYDYKSHLCHLQFINTVYKNENVSVCTNYYTETLKLIEFKFRINLTYIPDS